MMSSFDDVDDDDDACEKALTKIVYFTLSVQIRGKMHQSQAKQIEGQLNEIEKMSSRAARSCSS